MSDTRVRVGGAVQYVADLPANGNNIGDRRIVLEPPAGAESTTYRWDGAAWVPENAPLSGTLRLYVDGTNGDDTAQGTSWAEAWKTLAFSQERIEEILAPNPGNLRLDLYVRGAFANEDMILSGALAGSTTVNVIHHVDDWTEVATGTVNTVAATALGHGMRELTFNAPWVPAAADEGRWLVFTEGTNRIVYQVLRVSGATVTISTATVPAWLVGGGTVAVSVREPSVSGIASVRYGYQRAQHWDAAYDCPANVVLGLTCERFASVQTNCLRFSVKATGVLPIRIADSYDVRCCIESDAFYVTRVRAAEYGLLGLPGTNETCRCGSWTTNATSSGALRCEASTYLFLSGFFAGQLSGVINPMSMYAQYCSCSGIVGEHVSYVSIHNVIVRCAGTSAVRAYRCAEMSIQKTSFVDVAAAGISDGLIRVDSEGFLHLVSTVDGNNTGAGLRLYGCKVERGGKVVVDSCPSALTGDDGDWYIDDGEVEFVGNLSIAARAGGGPDVYCGPNSRVYFAGTVTKSATNPSGGGTAQPVLKCRRGAKVTMDATKAFTLPAGSGNNTTDYGATGAIDISTCCDVALGTLAGGAAGAVGTICTIKRASRLAHAGAGPAWGGAPIVVGGNAAAPWPAANPTSDAAAGVPEDCWVLPGSA